MNTEKAFLHPCLFLCLLDHLCGPVWGTKDLFELPENRRAVLELTITEKSQIEIFRSIPVRIAGSQKKSLSLDNHSTFAGLMLEIQGNFLLCPDDPLVKISGRGNISSHLSKMLTSHVSEDLLTMDPIKSECLSEKIDETSDLLDTRADMFLLFPEEESLASRESSLSEHSKGDRLEKVCGSLESTDFFLNSAKKEKRTVPSLSSKTSNRCAYFVNDCLLEEGERLTSNYAVRCVLGRKEFIDSMQEEGLPFALEAWKRLKGFEIYNLGYPVSQFLISLFRDLEYLSIDNSESAPLQEDMVLDIDHLRNLRFIKLSYDPKLYVKSYDSIVGLDPGMSFKTTPRKVISGPLFSGFEDGETPVPALGHPLLFDNSGFAPGLAERTQKIFGTMPSGDKYVQVEFFGANHLTAIDFGGLPVTASFFESLLQAQITTTLDGIADWGERLCWSNKFVALEWLDLSHTSINDLTVIRNLQRLQFLRLNDTAFLNLEDSRVLHRLVSIESGNSSCSFWGRFRGNLSFLKLSILNFGRLKHNLRFLVIGGTILATYTFNAFIRALLKEEVAAMYSNINGGSKNDFFQRKVCWSYNPHNYSSSLQRLLKGEDL